MMYTQDGKVFALVLMRRVQQSRAEMSLLPLHYFPLFIFLTSISLSFFSGDIVAHVPHSPSSLFLLARCPTSVGLDCLSHGRGQIHDF